MIKEKFLQLKDRFEDSDYARSMKETVENSPYHREANVWVHTEMVVAEYIAQSPDKWSVYDLMGAISCLFHDVGKPGSEEETRRDDGTTRRSYKGHEEYSGGIWMNIWCDNEFDVKSLIDDVYDAYNIMVMISYHLPYRMNADKQRMLFTHLSAYQLTEIFIRMLRSDNRGRTSDQEIIDNDNIEDFIEGFTKHNIIPLQTANAWMMVGLPGSGKSRYSRIIPDQVRYSFDDIRETSFQDASTYHQAFNRFNDYDFYADKRLHGEFGVSVSVTTMNGFFNAVLVNTIKESPDKTLVIDNTSLSRSGRRKMMNVARSVDPSLNFGAVFVMASVDIAYHNNCLRGDYKTLNKWVIANMNRRICPPILGEMSTVSIIVGQKH